MVILRLTRRGTKKRPFYHVVAADKRFSRDGRFLADLGTYDPLNKDKTLVLDVEKANAWLAKGAQMSPVVTKLVRRATAAQTASA